MTKHSRTPVSSRIAVLLTAIAALGLVGPVSVAGAADATKAQYDDEVTQVAANVGSGGPPAQDPVLQQEVVSALPFTGLDVIALLAVAVALTSMGLVLRRLTADRHAS